MKQSLERSGFPRQIDILFPSRPLLETVTFRQLTARYYDCPPADICPSSPLTESVTMAFSCRVWLPFGMRGSQTGRSTSFPNETIALSKQVPPIPNRYLDDSTVV